MGLWTFAVGVLVDLAGWMIGNGSSGFASYPFILLNLILSCLAAMQGAILLIAASGRTRSRRRQRRTTTPRTPTARSSSVRYRRWSAASIGRWGRPIPRRTTSAPQLNGSDRSGVTRAP
jgi:hypothetical protein